MHLVANVMLVILRMGAILPLILLRLLLVLTHTAARQFSVLLIAMELEVFLEAAHVTKALLVLYQLRVHPLHFSVGFVSLCPAQ